MIRWVVCFCCLSILRPRIPQDLEKDLTFGRTGKCMVRSFSSTAVELNLFAEWVYRWEQQSGRGCSTWFFTLCVGSQFESTCLSEVCKPFIPVPSSPCFLMTRIPHGKPLEHPAGSNSCWWRRLWSISPHKSKKQSSQHLTAPADTARIFLTSFQSLEWFLEEVQYFACTCFGSVIIRI